MLYESESGNFALALLGDVMPTRRLSVFREERYLKLKDTLGARIVEDRETQCGLLFIRLDLHGLSLNVTGFLEFQELEQHYGMEHLAIDTDNFAAEVAKLKASGVKILEERKNPGGQNVCFFEGPDGVRLEYLEMKK